MKPISNTLYILFLLLILFSCNNNKNNSVSLEEIKYNNNKNSYTKTKMDSAEAINSILTQKAQEILDLASLYSRGNKDTEIDTVVYSQMLGYFYKPDSTTLKPLLSELDSLKAKSAKIRQLKLYQNYYKKDTLNYAKFNVEYFNENNRSITNVERRAQYIIVPAPIKFKKEFKFFFLNFYTKPLNDSILSDSTK